MTRTFALAAFAAFALAATSSHAARGEGDEREHEGRAARHHKPTPRMVKPPRTPGNAQPVDGVGSRPPAPTKGTPITSNIFPAQPGKKVNKLPPGPCKGGRCVEKPLPTPRGHRGFSKTTPAEN
jgi:hypothetical protein